jgi:hypothetical protein
MWRNGLSGFCFLVGVACEFCCYFGRGIRKIEFFFGDGVRRLKGWFSVDFVNGDHVHLRWASRKCSGLGMTHRPERTLTRQEAMQKGCLAASVNFVVGSSQLLRFGMHLPGLPVLKRVATCPPTLTLPVQTGFEEGFERDVRRCGRGTGS